MVVICIVKLPTGDTIVISEKDAQRMDALYCFRAILLFIAALESFAHGSNDTGVLYGTH